MSRGLGRIQLRILVILAHYEADEGKTGRGLLVEEIAQRFRPSRKKSVAGLSSIRRALAKMRSAGLVQTRYWWPNNQGQPRLWKITGAGLAEVRRYRTRPSRVRGDPRPHQGQAR